MISRSDHLFLVGMMGSGKTTVGRDLAQRIMRPYFDSDEEVLQQTGKTVPQIFAESGEAAFRREEKAALTRACVSKAPSVIAVAGGAVLDPENRKTIQSAGRVVWLRAEVATLSKRVGDGHGRPLLEDDVPATLSRLLSERSPIYEELADIVIDVDQWSSSEVVGEILEHLRERVVVELSDRSYEVVIGPGTRMLVDFALPDSARRAVIVTQKSIGVEVACTLASTTHFIGDGEQAKSLSTIESLCRAFAQAGLSRNDVVVAVGGGVVTDVAGFAAAVYHRGTAVIHVPTTLLGQVDAAIGGKTGVNIAEGKNLVGAFFQPAGVFCDTDTLASLPEREWRSGLGEIAKYAFLGVDDLDRLPLVEQVARCVELKAEVVSGDEREAGRRAILNYGHTLGHALEAIGFEGDTSNEPVDLRHGEAVAIGLVFAARLAHLLGRIDAARVERHLEVVRSYGLPEAIPPGVDLGQLVSFMARDKKATDGLTFVLDGPKGVEVVNGVDKGAVFDALKQTVAL